MYIVGHVERLRKKYNKIRKVGGQTLQDFLNSPFEFPIIADPLPSKVVPPEMDGVGDLDTLRLGNVKLASELTDVEEKLEQEQNRSEILVDERDKAKRKALQCDELRKKQKAEHEKARYWQERAGEICSNEDALSRLKEVEKENLALSREITALQTQVFQLQDALQDIRGDKVSYLRYLLETSSC